MELVKGARAFGINSRYAADGVLRQHRKIRDVFSRLRPNIQLHAIGQGWCKDRLEGALPTLNMANQSDPRSCRIGKRSLALAIRNWRVLRCFRSQQFQIGTGKWFPVSTIGPGAAFKRAFRQPTVENAF